MAISATLASSSAGTSLGSKRPGPNSTEGRGRPRPPAQSYSRAPADTGADQIRSNERRGEERRGEERRRASVGRERALFLTSFSSMTWRLPTYLPTYLTTYLPTELPTELPPHPPTYPPTVVEGHRELALPQPPRRRRRALAAVLGPSTVAVVAEHLRARLHGRLCRAPRRPRRREPRVLQAPDALAHGAAGLRMRPRRLSSARDVRREQPQLLWTRDEKKRGVRCNKRQEKRQRVSNFCFDQLTFTGWWWWWW